jgi:hypothetical protein
MNSNDSLIALLEAKKQPEATSFDHPSDAAIDGYNDGINDAISIIRTHKPAPAPDVENRVYNEITNLCARAEGSLFRLLPSQRMAITRTAIAAMGEPLDPSGKATGAKDISVSSPASDIASEIPYTGPIFEQLADAGTMMGCECIITCDDAWKIVYPHLRTTEPTLVDDAYKSGYTAGYSAGYKDGKAPSYSLASGEKTGLCSIHKYGEDRGCKRCYPKPVSVSLEKVADVLDNIFRLSCEEPRSPIDAKSVAKVCAETWGLPYVD